MNHAKDALGATGVSQDLIELAENLIQTRQHIGPKHLTEPGPSRDLLLRLLEAAAAAPDHAQLRPWRFVAFGAQSRDKLAAAFADALLERDATALPEQLEAPPCYWQWLASHLTTRMWLTQRNSSRWVAQSKI